MQTKTIEPCKQGKCLLYPSCINKKIINCNIVQKHVNKYIGYYKEEIKDMYYTRLWNLLLRLFPNIGLYYINDKTTTYMISNNITGNIVVAGLFYRTYRYRGKYLGND